MPVALRVILPFGLAYVVSTLLRAINAVASEPITHDLGLTPGELGLLTSLYFAGFALAQIPLGIAMDRWGPRRMEASVMLLAAAGCGLFAVATGFPALAAGRFLMGLGTSLALMAPLTAYRLTFPTDRLPLMNGIHMAFGATGTALSGRPTVAAIHALGWQTVFGVIGIATIAAAAMIVLVVPRTRAAHASASFAGLTKALGTIYGSRDFWRIVPISSALQAATLSIGALWVGPWLRQVAGLSAANASAWLSLIALGLLAGFLLTGWIAQTAARRGLLERMIALCNVLVAALTALIAIVPPTIGTPLWVLYSILGASGVLCYPALLVYFAPNLAGRVNTAHNFVVFVTAFLMQWLFGVLLGAWTDGAGNTDPEGFAIGLWAIVAVQLLALLPLLMRRSTPYHARVSAGGRA